MKHVTKIKAKSETAQQGRMFETNYSKYFNDKKESDIMNNTNNNTVNDTINDNVYWMITAEDILNSLFDPDEEVCFRIVADKKKDPFRGNKESCKCGSYAQMEQYLKGQNEQGRGIFFVVNYGGQSDEDIIRINAQFVDMDNGSLEEQQQKLEDFALPPSMVIKTQKSLHAYWFMDRSAKVERFRTIQMQLVKQFGGDTQCENESRPMRLPGFNHHKTDKAVPVECISFHPERRYTQEQLSKVLPKVDMKPVEVIQSGKEKGLKVVMETCDFLKHCKEDASTLSEPEWYNMISNLAIFEGGNDAIQKLSAPYPGYSRDATVNKINHFYESGTKPITCKNICEKGFKCPKRESGECDAKAPAALSQKPMEVDTLMNIITGLPVHRQDVKDMETAREFIRDYLYNQDEVIADAIITDSLLKHFGLKATYRTALKKEQREVKKEYDEETKKRMAKEDTSMPFWYEQAKNGVRFIPGRLAEHMAETQNVIYAVSQYYKYDDGVYSEMSQDAARHMIQKQMLTDDAKTTQINDAENQWRLQIQHDGRELNSNPYIINLKNGLYYILEDELKEHTPDYFSTIQLNACYDKNADCPRFKKFLEDSMEGDMGQVELLQEMLGYFLVPVTSAQKCFIIVGEAAAGKSVLLNVVEALLGEQNVSNVSWQDLNDKFKTASLFGKLANIFADLPTKNIEDNGVFKALVGEDSLTAEKKYKDPFNFKNTARLLFSCNTIPRNSGDRSEGYYRRLIIIRFRHSVPEEERDPELLKKLQEEMDGIFLYALEGLKRLIANNYKFSETEVNKKELQNYREDSDSVLAFVNARCQVVPGSNDSIGSTKLHNEYKEYCADKGLIPCSQIEFVKRLEASFGVERAKDSTGNLRTLKGIKYEYNGKDKEVA